jgi:hypothetical protein
MLKKGYGAKTISKNIGHELKRHPGMTPAQAVAISLSSARHSAEMAHKPAVVRRLTPGKK